MLVLGWHGSWEVREFEDASARVDLGRAARHDGAAVIVRDGEVVAAVEEERLNRIKHSNFFPLRAIRFCLAQANASLTDVDAIVLDFSESYLDLWVTRYALENAAVKACSGKAWVADLFFREFGVDVTDKIRFCQHHLAHLYGVWHVSGFSSALTVCLDAQGDGHSGLVAHCTPTDIKILRHLPPELSLGMFYLAIIGVLGYRIFDEYKVMGLAPYGNPKTYESLFRQMYQLLPEGKYAVAARLDLLKSAGIPLPARRKGEPFTQLHMDIAAALQVTLETIVAHMVEYFQRITGLRTLCLSGGIAHNCSMNGSLLRSGLFDQIYVQPAAHDAGNALGAAFAMIRDKAPIPSAGLRHVYLGPEIGSDEDVGKRLECWAKLVHARKISDIARHAAQSLADGKVLGWVQGRSEFGPRSLGNRSIVADPRPVENKLRINAMVKKREDYRPFAPSVLADRMQDFFEMPPSTDALPFMVFTVPVRPEKRAILGAITHVDGTARVQSVSEADNPRFHALIDSFGQLTGIPMVLNTSFNNDAEPIVDSIDDAITCFLTTGIDALVIGDWYIEKQPVNIAAVAFETLVPILSPGRKLAIGRGGVGEEKLYIDSTASDFFVRSPISVSRRMFEILVSTSDGKTAAGRLQTDISSETMTELAAELCSLWERRAIQLSPSRVS